MSRWIDQRGIVESPKRRLVQNKECGGTIGGNDGRASDRDRTRTAHRHRDGRVDYDAHSRGIAENLEIERLELEPAHARQIVGGLEVSVRDVRDLLEDGRLNAGAESDAVDLEVGVIHVDSAQHLPDERMDVLDTVGE